MLNILLNLNISNEMVLISSGAILLVILCCVVFTMISTKRSENKEIDSIISSMVQERKAEETAVNEDKVVNEDKDINENKIVNETKEEVIEPVEEVDDKTKELEDVLEQMQKDLEAKPEEVVANFEKEQEEKAIISYTELVKTLKQGKEEERTLNTLVDEIKETAITNEEKEDKKFRNTDFISPVYGKMEEHLDYPKVSSFQQEDDILKELKQFDQKISQHKLDDYLEEFHYDNNVNTLEQTLDMEPISNEIKKNEEFLNALKEFRENL